MKSIAALATAGLLALTALPAPAAEMLMRWHLSTRFPLLRHGGTING